jgi:hypothetical protein
MSKKREEAKSSMIAAAQRAALAAAQATYGIDRVYVAGDHGKHQFGFDVPSLPLRYLIGMSAWPLQRITQSQGPQFSCKSAFIFQLEKWVLEAGGAVFHVDTENKVSASLQASMIPSQYLVDPEYKLMYQQASLDSVNRWQQYVTDQLKNIRTFAKQFNEKKPEHLKKPDYMTFIAVDSMMGSGSEEASKYVQKHGEAQGRTFSDASLLIANYMREIPSDLLGWPVTVHFSHHEKHDPSSRFGGTRTPGGDAPGFMATLDLVFSVGWAKPAAPGEDGEYGADGGSGSGGGFIKDYDGKTARPGVQGRWITIGIKKNSEGPAIKRRISVPFIWRYERIAEPLEGQPAFQQVTWWDWDTALVDLCIKQTAALKDILTLKKLKKGQHEAYACEAAGVTEEDPLLPHELGAVIHANPVLVAAIENALCVNRLKVFHPDIWEEINPARKKKD